jgi:hypothetical protein
MSSLKKEYSNYYRNSIKLYMLVEVPLPNFSKLESELAYLEQEEVNTN